MTPAPVRLVRAALLALASPVLVSAALQPDVAALDPGKTVDRHLDRRDAHRYQLSVVEGECVRVIVEQRGVDVLVDVRAPDGTTIAQVHDALGPRGDERIDVVGDPAGTYTLVVRAAYDMSIAPESTYAIRVEGRRAATGADRVLRDSRTRRLEAVRMERAGQYREARAAADQALRLAESVLAADDPYVARLMALVADESEFLIDRATAERLYPRALAVLEQVYGVEHPIPAYVRGKYATMFWKIGQFAEADKQIRAALPILEKTLGAEHPHVSQFLTTQGLVALELGDFQTAEAINRRVLALEEQQERTEDIVYAQVLSNLSEVYRRQEDYTRAQEYARRALASLERALGPEHYRLTFVLQNMGIIARERKDYAAAEAYYTRALAIRERVMGPDHPEVAQLLSNLAIVYRNTGDDARAIETSLRALRTFQRVLGPYHGGTLVNVGNIARMYAKVGDLPHAIAYQRDADTIVERQLSINLAIGSERQKLALVRSMAERTDRTVSLHLLQAPEDPDAAALAALVLLQRKGRVLDAMTDTLAAVRQRLVDRDDGELLDQLRDTIRMLARVALVEPDKSTPEEREARIAALEARREKLEADLSAHSAAFRAQTQPVTLEAVRQALPADAALVELAVFRPFDPKAERNAEAYDAPHYAAYVLRKDGAVRGIDLGPARTIDDEIDALRAALRDPLSADVRRRARAVHARVMKPLAPAMGTATRLLISPDGDLNLVPFDALIDEQGRYLVQRYAISYLTSGRDLLRMQATRASHGRPAIIADPLFGEPDTTGAPTTYFAPLAATGVEARAIKALFPDAAVFTGARATKAALQQLDAPRVLHIASHGFFLDDARAPVALSSASPTSPSTAAGTRAIRAAVDVENPLLRSGLAFAGANLSAAHGDGILTALEASSLNLWGTKLVTLSACDTAVGEVRNGEGVYGLRRAFVLAGAETLVMTLWAVNDTVTREMMTAYYAGLRAGLGRGDALRQAKLAMLTHTSRRHPAYWGGFIQSGEWANLAGRR